MGNYVLTEEQEDDFRFANAGREFADYLKESLQVWSESAKTNRRIVIQKSLNEMNDETVQKVIDAANLRNQASIILK